MAKGMLGNLTPRQVILGAIAIYFAVGVLPDVIDTVFAVDTTNWSPTAQTLWDIAPLALVATIVLVFVPKGDNS